ncbi:MAG: hypothetical protein ACE5MI_02505 [Acidimicrobiia bacterium]
MARHRQARAQHRHNYDVHPTAGGIVRLICRDCGQIGVGLTEDFTETPALRTEDARSILQALAGPRKSPWPELASS